MIKRLRVKFILVNMSIVTVMICAIFSTIYYFTKSNLEVECIRMMQQAATEPTWMRLPDKPPQQVRLPYFTVRLGHQNELLRVDGVYSDLFDEVLLEEVLQAALNNEKDTDVLASYDLRFYKMNTPPGRVVVFADISSEQSTLSTLWKTSVLLGSASLLIFLGISVLLAKWAVRPVEEAWRRQRQFVADASHELKTPLTAILANAELLQASDCSEENRSQFSAHILTMARHMRVLVEQMLELARADSGQQKQVFVPIELSQLALEVSLPYEPVFFEQGMELQSRLEEGIWVSGNPDDLRRLMEIFLDNAQKYAADGGKTVLTLTHAQRNKCLLIVSNQGTPIPHEELQQLFKRFYRSDQARSRPGSFGLGLSIAQSITHHHRGRIWAESENGINSFFVELPVL